ncbi:MFS transporter [Fodinicurvata sp. EGI_FJ10296]|uniref:MFS transporter n=1 Tax=Fodinicurvata sp. EGI_FJ10296 TaxID=3231908 RepID=UPI0034566296
MANGNIERRRILFLNVGHAYDHWFMLIYATAVIAMEREFDLGYGGLMALSTPGFIAFGLGAIPAGWLGDRWSREGMITVFFVGLGAASVLVGLARTPVELGVALTLLGCFAAIYHPVGIAMIAEGASGSLGRRIGVNGVWGNMGVAGAAVVTGLFVDSFGWRSAFVLPGLLAAATGLAFLWTVGAGRTSTPTGPGPHRDGARMRDGWQRVLAVVAAITVVSAIIFNAVTIAMPKVLEERLVGITITATGIGFAASAVYAIAAFTQIAVGRALDRYAVRGLLTFLALGQVVAFAAAAFAMNWSLLAAVLVLMIMVFGQVPVGSILIARYTPDVIRARVYGFQYLLVFGVGALAVPLIAIQYQWGGFAGLFLIMAAMAVVIVLIAQMLPETRPAESVSTGRA